MEWNTRSHHTATLRKRSPRINTTCQKAWRIIGDIASMPVWAPGVIKVDIISDSGRGVGAVRQIEFEDGRSIEEHVVSWDAGSSFTYVATEGLPLRAYVATITVKEDPKGGIRITWQSYLDGSEMTKREFAALLEEMGAFYNESLANLKKVLQARR